VWECAVLQEALVIAVMGIMVVAQGLFVIMVLVNPKFVDARTL
tara:strand:- start:1317 stop:1445 length:129 start_codon:yes stop_codon:yes gene_type:complete